MEEENKEKLHEKGELTEIIPGKATEIEEEE